MSTVQPAASRGERLIVVTALINQLGNWFTFLAIIVHVQAQHGSASSAAVFLAQTVPALIAARSLSDRVPRTMTKQAWIALQIVLAAMTISMSALNDHLIIIYVYVAVSALLRAVSNPLFYTVAINGTHPDRRKAVLTAVSGAGSLSLVISPAIGGVLADVAGIGWLFVVDAATFVIASMLIGLVRMPPQPAVGGSQLASRPGLIRHLVWPQGAGSGLIRPLGTWFAFVLLGAALNSVELPTFDNWLMYDSTGFGIALSMYGLGGLISFVFTLVTPAKLPPLGLSAGAYLLGLVLWVVPLSVLPAIGFLLAGAGSTFASGAIRHLIAARAEEDGVDVQGLWGWANQVTLFANLAMYGLFTALFGLGASVGACLVILAIVALGWVVSLGVARRHKTVSATWVKGK
jgi:MFS family permease